MASVYDISTLMSRAFMVRQMIPVVEEFVEGVLL